jgi:iron complex outermembrane recepter protein
MNNKNWLNSSRFKFPFLMAVLQLPLTGVAQVSESSGATPKAAPAKVIEEVIVSATKRDTGLQDTGIAISVLGKEDMAFRDMSNLEEMQNAVPGLHVGAIMGTPIINIRGIGLNLMTGSGTPGVATHYDGVYIPRNGSTTTATVDLAQVEVLRGPQGTLYGRNATGGSINFIGKRPANEFGAGITAGMGDYERRFYEGYIEGPLLSDRLSARVYLKKDDFGGYGINEANGKAVGDNEATMGRVALLYDLTDSLSLYASYSRRDDEGSYPYQTALNIPKTLLGQSVPSDSVTFTPRNTKLSIDPVAEKTTEIANLTVNWQSEKFSFKSITGYIEHDRYEFYSPVDSTQFIAYLERPEYSEAWSQEFNFSGSWFDDRLNVLLGLYYGEDDGVGPLNAFINVDGLTTLPLPQTGAYVYMDPQAATVDTSQAVFLDGYWSVLDSLRLVFGIRFSTDEQEFTQTFQPDLRLASGTEVPLSSLIVGLLPLFSETCEDLTSRYETESTDPKLGLEWNVTDGVMLYTQYQTGYKSGGFDITVSCTANYDPEEIESYEAGLKTTLLDGALTLNAAVFDYAYTNFQVQQVEGFGSKIENAPEASSRGAEIELTYNPSFWFALDAQYSYLDTEYTEYFSRDGYRNTTILINDAPLEDLSGNKLSRSPENSVNIGSTFFLPIQKFGLSMAQLRLEMYYSDELYFREFNRDIERQEAYTLYNAYLSIASESDRYKLNLFVKNITDEDYQVGQLPMDIVKYRGGYYAPPKTYGASFSAMW